MLKRLSYHITTMQSATEPIEGALVETDRGTAPTSVVELECDFQSLGKAKAVVVALCERKGFAIIVNRHCKDKDENPQ